jgi:alpha-tubulin suppressor-like RCC1 family protein
MKRVSGTRLLLACALLGLGACEDPAGAGDRKLARVVVVSGDLQAATAGTELPEALVVRAEDSRGRPVAGEVLTFAVTAGAGQIFAAAVETDDEGMARNRWTLGTAVGDTQRVEVRATDPADGLPRAFAQFRALARPGAPATIEIYRGNAQTGVVGATLADSLSVIVRDQNRNLVPGVGVTWSSPSGGSILPNPAPTDAQGVARVGWTLPTRPGPVSAVATVGGASVTFSGTAVVGPTVSVTVTPSPIEGRINSTVLVEAFPRDQYGNATEGPIDFIIGDPDIAYISSAVTGLKFNVYLRGVGETTLTARIRGTSTEVVVPVRVPAIAFSRVAAGAERSCGLTNSGQAYCWGGTPAAVPFPGLIVDVDVDVMYCAMSMFPISGRTVVRCSAFPEENSGEFVRTAVGGQNVCAWTVAGSAYCWGLSNTFGQLGIGTRTSTRTATAVAGGREYTQISAGLNHMCAISSGNAAYCWGLNQYGELGTGSATGPQACDAAPCSTVPVAVTGGIAFRSVTVGVAHSCGLDTGGAAWCWGANDSGQLGDGTRVQRNAPVRAAAALTFQSLAAGYHHTCGITTGGETWCWGSNSSGELGNGTIGGSSEVPVRVTGGITFTQINGGREYTCAVATDSRAWCWGDNAHGQLGIGTGPDRATPQRVRG